jgi:hypothetical protein
MKIVPCAIKHAKLFVKDKHRHNKAPIVCLFAVGLEHMGERVGVALVGLPIARAYMDGTTCEVVRCCVIDHAPKGACSMLYAACWRAAKALGYRRMLTYTLQEEGGDSLRGAGFTLWRTPRDRQPHEWQNRPGRTAQAVTGQPKWLWKLEINPPLTLDDLF